MHSDHCFSRLVPRHGDYDSLLAPAHALARDVVVLGEPDPFIGRGFEHLSGAAFGRARTDRRNQQGLRLAGKLALCCGARLLAERHLHVAKHEVALGPIDGRAAHPDAPRDLLVASAGICSQQNLRRLRLHVPAAAEEGLEFMTFGLAEFDPIAYIHPMPPVHHRVSARF